MPKSKVWVHATQEEAFHNGWKTEFREMVTQHFDIITAQGIGATICNIWLCNITERLAPSPPIPNLHLLTPMPALFQVEVTPSGKF